MSARCFIIAEAGVNHNGSPDLARRLIDAAADAGADAVKFQTFRAERIVAAGAVKAEYQQRTTGEEEDQLTMLRRLELPEAAHAELQERCQQRALEFLSTGFDEESVDFLAELGVPRFKIPSGEITNLPFLQHLARRGRPLILSTGMSTLGEVETAIRTIQGAGSCPLTLLHCVSNYPAPMETVNLRAMETMAIAFGLPVGFSDHTMGIEVATAAVALGACVIEKHLTLDRTLPGPDHAASLTPEEFSAMTSAIRNIERALGDGRKAPAASEAEVARVARKSLVAARDLPAGTVLERAHLVAKRPGTGLPPAFLEHLLGRTTRRALAADIPLSLDVLA